MALFHVFGRKWKKISTYLEGRDTLQCRTHGQKHIMALKKLKLAIQESMMGGAVPNYTLCQLIHKYENDRRQLINQFPVSIKVEGENKENQIQLQPNLLPQYLLTEIENEQASKLNFSVKLEHILAAIYKETLIQ